MEPRDFTQQLARLSGEDIRLIAKQLHRRHSSAADEVEWWQATIAIDRALRATGRSRAAAMAALEAVHAVQAVALAAGVALPDEDVTLVARAAADVARGLAAGPVVWSEAACLLTSWCPVLGPSLRPAA